MRSRAMRDMIHLAADRSLVENAADNIKTGRATMSLILIIIILVLLLGGGVWLFALRLPRRDRHRGYLADYSDRVSSGRPREVLTR